MGQHETGFKVCLWDDMLAICQESLFKHATGSHSIHQRPQSRPYASAQPPSPLPVSSSFQPMSSPCTAARVALLMPLSLCASSNTPAVNLQVWKQRRKDKR